jgi:hypothetical protein
MGIPILQRIAVSPSRHNGKPLQSRADQNTRKADSGVLASQEQAHRFTRCATAAEPGFGDGRRQTDQEIWPQLGSNCLTAVWSGSCRKSPRAMLRRLPEGDTL